MWKFSQLVSTIIIGTATQAVAAQTLSTADVVPNSNTASPAGSESVAVGLLIDRFAKSLRGADSVPRSAFVFVQGNTITVSRGYGMTANDEPVSAERTVFRAASNSKLFATVAALQLAQRGLWKLSDDINTYLPDVARVDVKFGRAVTIADLLTHTSGFENRLAGAVVPPSRRMTLAQFFAAHVPFRALSPGDELNYSNIGMAMAGYLVESVSQQSFEEYASQNILAPLGMTHSSFQQPAPPELAAHLAGGVARGTRDVVFLPYPAASLVTTPSDMGQFIIAQLNHGRLDRAQILDSSFVALMQATHWRAQPDVPGVAYGFFEDERNRQRYLFHTGDSGDHSLIVIVPERQVGFYFVYSGSDEQGGIRDRLAREMLNLLLGNELPATRLPSSDVSGFAGRYRNASYSRTNIEKLGILFSETRVEAGAGGDLLAWPAGSSAPIRFVRIGRNTFRADSGETIAFRDAINGAAPRFTLNGLVWDPSSWNRVPWFEEARLQIVALCVLALAVFFRAFVAPLARLLRRRRLRRTGESTVAQSPVARTLWHLSFAAAVTLALSPFVFAASALLLFTHPSIAIPIAARNATIFISAGELMGLVLLAAIVKWGWPSQEPMLERVATLLLGVACVVALPSLLYLRLLYPLSV